MAPFLPTPSSSNLSPNYPGLIIGFTITITVFLTIYIAFRVYVWRTFRRRPQRLPIFNERLPRRPPPVIGNSLAPIPMRRTSRHQGIPRPRPLIHTPSLTPLQPNQVSNNDDPEELEQDITDSEPWEAT